SVALPELSLDLDRAAYRVQDTREFHQRAVAHELDDAAGMGGDSRIDQFTPCGIQAGQRTSLINTYKAGIADDVGGQDCREPPLDALLRRHANRAPRRA